LNKECDMYVECRTCTCVKILELCTSQVKRECEVKMSDVMGSWGADRRRVPEMKMRTSRTWKS